MAIGESIQRHPLLRLVISYIGGIVLADALYQPSSSLALCSMMVGIIALLIALLTHRAERPTLRATYGIAAIALFATLGSTSYTLTRDFNHYSWPTDEHTYEAKVI